MSKTRQVLLGRMLRAAVWLSFALVGVRAAELYPTMRAPFATWVEDGQARADIVSEADTPATEELNTWLRRISGTALPVVPAPVQDRPHIFLGGEAAWAKLNAKREVPRLGADGYVIKSVGRDLVIAGETPLALSFGVSAFLEHYLDCRWFWPGENGMYSPSRPTLRIGQVDEVSRPDFRVRWIVREGDCARFNRLNVGVGRPGEFRVQWFVHTWQRLVPPKTYASTHPEFYPEFGGKRKVPDGDRQINLCSTNPAVVQAAAETIDAVLARDPNVNMVSVDPMDSQRFCQCAACRRLQQPDAPYERRMSGLVFDFTNRLAQRVAEKHPDLLLKTIAYHTYLAPPKQAGFRLHQNVAVQFCRFMCHNHPLNDPSCAENRHFNAPLVAWTKLSRNVMMYEYYYKASWCGLPWPILPSVRQDIPYLKRLGVMGLATQWDHNAAGNGLAFYVATKLLWDSTIDVDALLADFYEKAYGAAAGPMREFHRRIEAAAAAADPPLHLASQRPYRDMLRFLGSGLLTELDASLGQAEARVRDPGATARVQLMRRHWRYCRLVRDYLGSIAEGLRPYARARWAGQVPSSRLVPLQQAAAPFAQRIREFLRDKQNAGAVHALGNYEELLLSPQSVIRHWQAKGDRPPEGAVFDKPAWLEKHPEAAVPRPSPFLALWVYGNDLDWVRDTGAEHSVYVRNRQGATVKVGEIGRQDRVGDGVNLCFVIRGIAAAGLPRDELEITIENPTGGPYASRVFAIYLMPDDGVAEDRAQELIDNDIEAVRRRAFGFAEYGYAGVPSDEGRPVVQPIRLVSR